MKQDLVERLEALIDVGSAWADDVEALRDSISRQAGAGAALSIELAARRAEQAFVELQTALDDVRSADGRRVR